MVVAENTRKHFGSEMTSCRRCGFTLVELVIVIGVLMILVAILLPTISGVRETARAMRCQNNLHQLGQAIISFAADHENTLPGSYQDRARTDASQRDWLLGSSTDMQTAPTTGTLFNYVGKNASVYRCPSLETAFHQHYGSNGFFDYTFFLSFTGARLENIKPTSQFTYPDHHTQIVPTPVLTEEDPWYSINRSSVASGAHVTTNRLAHTHRGQCFYWCVDGTVASFNEPMVPDAFNWASRGHSGKWIYLKQDVRWGWWNSQ